MVDLSTSTARRLSPLLFGALLAAVSIGSACSSSGGGSGAAPPSDAGVASDAPPPLEATPPGIIPPARRLDAASTQVVFDRLRGGVWTANGDIGTVSYVDVDHQKVLREIPVGQNVTSVALSPDFVWLAAVDRTNATVSLIDASAFQVRRTLSLGTHPRQAVWDASDPRWLYVSVEDDGAVAVVDRTLGVVSHEVPAGRLPAGLAVSALRDELTVTHRIDAALTILPLAGVYSPADQGQPLATVPLDYDAPVADDTQPSGQPFSLDGIAWVPGGDLAWFPHELLANHHPFQFQRNLFPAVSVVDLSARAEVETDPNDPFGVIAGRKLLFGAIDLLDATGAVSVVSDPCAAAIHPAGLVGYVLACASEDLLTFDMTSGIAIDLLRNLPGDHPTGIGLDGTGARAFIVSDQSHTLLTLDTAGGSPVAHATILAGPLSLVATDTVDPQLRAGLELFFSANSSKYPLPTTGNDWMSCGGCHLDGFVSTNEVFFEALRPLDPASDALIGHEGLKDFFSTTPDPTASNFNPHDVLSALLDQGGLAPDRTGADRTGQVDPSSPPSTATSMAAQIARVVGRDLPQGPAWLLPEGGQPDVSYDTSWCGRCHAAEYAAWQLSAHAHSIKDPMVLYGSGVEQQEVGPQYSKQCAGCHDPVSLRLGDSSLASGRGITCLGCHDVARLIRAGGNSDMETQLHDWTQSHVQSAGASLAYLKTPDFCAVCHQQFVPGGGMLGITTLTEWQAGPFAPQVAAAPDGGAPPSPLMADTSGPHAGATGSTCVDCHMPDVGSGVHDHAAPGGNVYMAQQFSTAAFAQTVAAKMATAMKLQATVAEDGVHVLVMNTGSGHAFPTGVIDIREPWVEVQTLDASHNVLATYGGPDANGVLPLGAARFGMDLASASGQLLYRHDLTLTEAIPFQRVVPAGGSVEVVVPVPAGALTASGVAEVDAVLEYHNIRTQYFQLATGATTGTAPTVEVARAALGSSL